MNAGRLIGPVSGLACRRQDTRADRLPVASATVAGMVRCNTLTVAGAVPDSAAAIGSCLTGFPFHLSGRNGLKAPESKR